MYLIDIKSQRILQTSKFNYNLRDDNNIVRHMINGKRIK